MGMSPSRIPQTPGMMGNHAGNMVTQPANQGHFLPQGQFPSATGGAMNVNVGMGQPVTQPGAQVSYCVFSATSSHSKHCLPPSVFLLYKKKPQVSTVEPHFTNEAVDKPIRFMDKPLEEKSPCSLTIFGSWTVFVLLGKARLSFYFCSIIARSMAPKKVQTARASVIPRLLGCDPASVMEQKKGRVGCEEKKKPWEPVR